MLLKVKMLFITYRVSLVTRRQGKGLVIYLFPVPFRKELKFGSLKIKNIYAESTHRCTVYAP